MPLSDTCMGCPDKYSTVCVDCHFRQFDEKDEYEMEHGPIFPELMDMDDDD